MEVCLFSVCNLTFILLLSRSRYFKYFEIVLITHGLFLSFLLKPAILQRSVRRKKIVFSREFCSHRFNEQWTLEVKKDCSLLYLVSLFCLYHSLLSVSANFPLFLPNVLNDGSWTVHSLQWFSRNKQNEEEISEWRQKTDNLIHKFFTLQ